MSHAKNLKNERKPQAHMINPSVQHIGKANGLPSQQNYFLSAGELVEGYLVISVAPSRQMMESRYEMGRLVGSAIVEASHACQNAGSPQTSVGGPQPSSNFLNSREFFRISFRSKGDSTSVETNQLLLEIGMWTNSPPTATLDDSGLDRAALDALLTKARTQKKSSTLLSLAKGALLRVFRQCVFRNISAQNR